MKKTLFYILILVSGQLFATQTYGGYIHYEFISGTTYELSVILWQDANSPSIQRREIEIN